MGYETHPEFKAPPDDAKLWRYIDLTKLVALLATRSLWFSRADMLGDPWEGAMPAGNRWSQYPGESNQGMAVLHEEVLKQTLISCWHRNTHESAAMWRLYLKSDEGVAIRTTFGRLRDSLQPKSPPIWIGCVTYLDYTDENMRFPGGTLPPFVHKRKSFEHEQEVRAVIQLGSDAEQGLAVPVDLDGLIEAVFVAPTKSDLVRAAIQSILDRYEIKSQVIRSSLDDEPLY